MCRLRGTHNDTEININNEIYVTTYEYTFKFLKIKIFFEI